MNEFNNYISHADSNYSYIVVVAVVAVVLNIASIAI